MVRLLFFFTFCFLFVSCQANRLAECAALCGNRMTLECCECIGCHQGMRFGKRSPAPIVKSEPSREAQEVAGNSRQSRSLFYVLRRKLAPTEEAVFRIEDDYPQY